MSVQLPFRRYLYTSKILTMMFEVASRYIDGRSLISVEVELLASCWLFIAFQTPHVGFSSSGIKDTIQLVDIVVY